MKISIFGLIIYICLLSVIPLYSQELPIKKVTLEECIEIAVQNHPEIKLSFEERKDAIAQYRLSQSRNRVQINAEIKTVEYLKENSDKSNEVLNIPGKDTVIGLFAGPTVTYNLIDSRKSDVEDSARLAVDLSKTNVIKVRDLIISNVKKAYYGYLFASENTGMMMQLVDKFSVKLQKAQILFKTGQRPILDVTKSDVDLGDAKLQYEKAKNQESLMKTELLASMGIMDDDIDFSPVKVSQLPQLRFSLKELYSLAEEYYPDIKIAKIRKDINRLNISVAQSAHMPTVDLLASFGFENTTIFDNDTMKYKSYQERFSENWELSSHFGIRAKVPIYSGGGIEAAVESAEAEYNKSKYIEKEILVRMKAMIRNYFNSLNEYKKQIEISKLIIDNAEKHLMLARKSYENGIGSQLDMQDAETAVIKAVVSRTKAGYDYLITLALLANVIGLDEEYICQN